MSSRGAYSVGPGTVKEHVQRIKGQQYGASSGPAAAAQTTRKQSLGEAEAAAAASASAAAAAGASSAAAAADVPMSSIVVLPQSSSRVEYLRFSGSKMFRERLVCATLAGRPVRIDEIRAMDERPGIRGQQERN
jgi:hypothetical protein